MAAQHERQRGARRTSDSTEAATERASSEALAGLVEAIDTGVLVWGERVLYANAAAGEIFGRPAPAGLLGLAAVEALFSAETAPAVAALLAASRSDAPARGHCKARARQPDAPGPWVHLQARAIRWGGQAAVLLSVTTTDEREQWEAELGAQQRLLQDVLDQVPIAVWVTDLEGRHRVVNRQMALYCGAEAARLLGATLDDLAGIPPEVRGHMAEQDRQVLSTGRMIDIPEMAMPQPDGQTAWRHIIKSPLRDKAGRIIGQIGICEDITARHEAEALLVEMASALEQAGDAIMITGLDGSIRYVNAAFERLTGYAGAEAIGQTPRLLRSNQQSPGFYAEVWATLLRGEVWIGRYINRRKDGSLYHTHSTHSPIRDKTGRTVGFLSVQRDVTEQVELDERMLRAQRLQALGTLAGGIAHDFNNVLLPIMGYTEMLSRRLAAGSQEADWLQVIADASQRARDLVARILLFTRQTPSTHVPMLLEPVVREVVSFLRSTVPTTVVLHANVAADDWILGDPAQMHQVLMNLCVNAAQAMPDGGDLTLSLDAVQLAGLECYLGRKLSGRHVRLDVADNGEGMDADTLSRIFEPFFTTKAVGSGTGLGLSTVFGIVLAHDGALRVQSAPGSGSRFELYFPVADAPPLPADPRDEPAAVHGTERVLVLDDEPTISELLQTTLGELGYRVTTLTSSREAIALLEAQPAAFDAVITDQTMPECTGVELATRLRQRNRNVPIILCTGCGDEALPEPGAGGVLSGLLHKPYRTLELAALLRRLLDRR
jgi:PAS domain S-box-containing protein